MRIALILLFVLSFLCSGIVINAQVSVQEKGLKENNARLKLKLCLSVIHTAESKGRSHNLFPDYYMVAYLYSLLERSDSAFLFLSKAYSISSDISTIHDYYFRQYHSYPKWKSLFDQQLAKFKQENKRLKQLTLATKIITLSGLEQSVLNYGRYFTNRQEQLIDDYKKIKKEAGELLRSISKSEYPDVEDVGTEGLKHLFLLIQHNNDTVLQKVFLAKMKKAAAKNDSTAVILNPKIAYLEDRILVSELKPQVYGTQFGSNRQLFPIADSVNVNLRRKAMGLEPLENYLELIQH